MSFEIQSIDASASEVKGIGEEEMFDREEQLRLGRTMNTFSKSMKQLELPHRNDRFPVSKLSPISNPELVQRVGEAAAAKGGFTMDPSIGKIKAILGETTAMDIDTPEPTSPAPMEIDALAEAETEVQKTDIEQMLELLEQSNDMLANPEIPLPDDVNALFTNNESEPEKRNFLLQVNQLVAEMLRLLSDMSNRDRKKGDTMKDNYNVLSNLQAETTIKNGWIGLGISIGSLLVHGISASLGAGQFSEPISKQFQAAGTVWSSYLQADGTRYGNKINLLQTELQANASKSGDNSSWKGELVQSLSEAKEWMRASVRSNG